MSTSDDHGRGSDGVALCPIPVPFIDPQRLKGLRCNRPRAGSLAGRRAAHSNMGSVPFPGWAKRAPVPRRAAPSHARPPRAGLTVTSARAVRTVRATNERNASSATRRVSNGESQNNGAGTFARPASSRVVGQWRAYAKISRIGSPAATSIGPFVRPEYQRTGSFGVAS